MPIPLLALLLLAQANAEPPAIQVHGFVDAFYALNSNRPYDGASFIAGTGTTARRADELNVNSAGLEVALDPSPVGFHLTLAAGSGLDVVHAGEPAGPATGLEIWRAVYQASVSWKAPIGSGLLLEAGIYPSHIGFESFFSKDNWNYTRGWIGEFSPYYQAGLKASYTFDEHWSAQLHFLNGWQVIGDNNRAKAVGTQVAWTSDRATFAFNTFAGPELPGDDTHWRLFGDLTAQVKATRWLSLGATADLGWQDRPQGAALWHAAGLYARAALSEWAAVALRAEYYDDRDGFFSGASQVLGEGTATLELRPAAALIFKLEARHDVAGEAVFSAARDASGNPTFSTSQTLAIASAVATF
ncbi:MAG TPA: porin [Myxococcales bacterium]|nr:porin [Myxococcales bacterium]